MSTPLHRSESAPGGVTVRAVGRTDVGSTREHNEDAFLLVDLGSGRGGSSVEGETAAVTGGDGMLMMVADGLGGAAAGEIASRMAVELIREEMERAWDGGAGGEPDDIAEALQHAVETANTRLHAYAREHPEHKGMGTTVTVAVLRGDTLFLAQIGDSRAYIVRNGAAEQVTKDQSLMQRLIEAGELTPEEAERSERRNIILQALGPEPTVRIDLTHQRIRHGDRLLLCTDGLSGVLRREELARQVGASDDLPRICERLIDRANSEGGPDNITVVIASFHGDALGSASPEEHVGYTVFPLAGEVATPSAAHPPYLARTTGPMPAVTPEELAAIAMPGTGISPANRALALAVGLTLLAALLLFALRQVRGMDNPGREQAPALTAAP